MIAQMNHRKKEGTMKLPIYQIDAFTDQLFRGNPAAVCPLESWLDTELMQKIALENNLSETAFFTGAEGRYALRWFTPVTEVDLCGHATLAAAWVIRNEHGDLTDSLQFQTRSGQLGVHVRGEQYTLDLPSLKPDPCTPPRELLEALGARPVQVYQAEDYLVEVENEQEVRRLHPDFRKLMEIARRGVIVTAPGERVDFVSRWFGPKVGVDEDPVTGSAHACLAPFWAEKLGKKELQAEQISQRGGRLNCSIKGNRVFISGKCVKFMEGTLHLGEDAAEY